MIANSFTPAEIEPSVIIERLHLYNRALLCRAQAIRKKKQENIRPLPLSSLCIIKRVLDHHALTYACTGHYP